MNSFGRHKGRIPRTKRLERVSQRRDAKELLTLSRKGPCAIPLPSRDTIGLECFRVQLRTRCLLCEEANTL
jgi:hypothetical protein